jgi:Uncharacterized protein conserved in bacteria (DUF2147)
LPKESPEITPISAYYRNRRNQEFSDSTIEGNLKVEVYKQNNEFKAMVIWFDDTDDKRKPMNERRDEKNPDKALRSRKWIGMEVLRHLRYYPQDNEWDDGKIYDIKTGKE